MMNPALTVRVTVENDGDVRADRLLEGQLIVRRGYVARVESVEPVDQKEVQVRLRYQHTGGADGREMFHALRGDTFPALRVVLA